MFHVEHSFYNHFKRTNYVHEGNIFDIFERKIFKGRIEVQDGVIKSIEPFDTKSSDYILPGLIDTHVHVESSLLPPTSFSELIVPRGTVGIVSDPHEIANVCGVDGVNYMIDNSKLTPLKCFFGAPSCVPATPFDNNGSVLNSDDVEDLLKRDDIWCLSEMMNYPGVICEDRDVIAKIDAAIFYGKPIDGHAPGISGDDLKKYSAHSISTDHECSTIQEALDKINLGMMIQIREGSAARNFEGLYSLFNEYPDKIMLCTDDSHPDEIIRNGHIDKIIRLGIQKGIDIFDLITAASKNIVDHYSLPVGLLRKDDPADFIVVDSLQDFNVLKTYINGKCLYDNGRLLFSTPKASLINNFNAEKIQEDSLLVPYSCNKKVKCIEVYDGDLITSSGSFIPSKGAKYIESNTDIDVLKIVVLNRYSANSSPSVAFIKNIGLKEGAFATTISHDNHNIIAVGVDDKSIAKAINEIIKSQGGLCVVNFNDDVIVDVLPLDIAGLMSSDVPLNVARMYEHLNNKIVGMGAKLKSPFMTISFMSLLVIPDLKISDKGLFDVSKFEYTSLYLD